MTEASKPSNARGRSLALWPLLIFAVLALVFYMGLSGNPSQIPSAMLGKPVPDFTLPPLPEAQVPGFTAKDLRGQGVTVVNVFASWCVPCRMEHPLLKKMSQQGVRLFGINNKDEPQNAMHFLRKLGQPYAAIGVDSNGRTSIDWGVYGVPESFIVDNEGVIRYKFIGPLTEQSLADFMAEVEKARQPLPPAL